MRGQGERRWILQQKQLLPDCGHRGCSGNGGAQRALLVQGRGRTSIVMCCHCDNKGAVNQKAAAVPTIMTPSLVVMALSTTQNNNQPTKGANKSIDGHDSVG